MRAARERYRKAQKKEAEEELAYFEMLTTGLREKAFKCLVLFLYWLLLFG